MSALEMLDRAGDSARGRDRDRDREVDHMTVEKVLPEIPGHAATEGGDERFVIEREIGERGPGSRASVTKQRVDVVLRFGQVTRL